MACAGTMVPHSGCLTNVYLSLIGPPHVGKSQTIIAARKKLGLKFPVYLNQNPGSAEGLIKNYLNANREPRLLNVDEIGALLGKAQITNASFPFLLNRLFNSVRGSITAEHQKVYDYNCRLSVIGGVVSDKFQEVFGAVSKGGLYDRFLFAAAPPNYTFLGLPIEDVEDDIIAQANSPLIISGPVPFPREPCAVQIDPAVYALRTQWVREYGMNPRVLEIIIRCAIVCCAFDQIPVLHAPYFAQFLGQVQYQEKVRNLFQPGSGITNSGVLSEAFLAYLDNKAPAGEQEGVGPWISQRDMFNTTNAYRIGPQTAVSVVEALVACGELQKQKVGKSFQVRRVF
jgi:hypothetical protein